VLPLDDVDITFIPPIKRRDDSEIQNYKVNKQNIMYMTLEKTKHQKHVMYR